MDRGADSPSPAAAPGRRSKHVLNKQRRSVLSALVTCMCGKCQGQQPPISSRQERRHMRAQRQRPTIPTMTLQGTYNDNNITMTLQGTYNDITMADAGTLDDVHEPDSVGSTPARRRPSSSSSPPSGATTSQSESSSSQIVSRL